MSDQMRTPLPTSIRHWLKVIPLFTAIIFGNNASAQRFLDIDEIQVIAPYEPTISDAFKINTNPVIEDTVRIDLDLAYDIHPQKIITRYQADTITPVRLPRPRMVSRHQGQVKGAYGNYQTPWFEGIFNTSHAGVYNLGVHMRHISSGQEIDGYPHSLYSHNKANIHGQRFFSGTTLGAGIVYDRHVVHYYGKPDEITLPEKTPGNDTIGLPVAGDIRQRYDLLSSHVHFGNNHKGSDRVNYHAGLSHQWLSDRYDGNEHHIGLKGETGRKIGADPFDIADRQSFRMDVRADHYRYTNLSDTSRAGIYSMRPKLFSEIDRLRFHIGVNLSVEDDNANFLLRAYPLAGLEMELIPDRLVAHLEASGYQEVQSWQKLSQMNPFVQSGPGMTLSNVRSVIEGGIRGSISSRVSYRLGLSNSIIDNYPLFAVFADQDAVLTDTYAGYDAFSVIYDDIRKLAFHAELLARFGERFSLRLRGDFFDYSMENQQKPWHKPDFLATMNVRYSLFDKINLTADLYGRSGAYGALLSDIAPVVPLSEKKLHDFYIDANLGVEYRYTKNFSVFLLFHNMPNESYERWLHYPTQAFSFLGGVSYGF